MHQSDIRVVEPVDVYGLVQCYVLEVTMVSCAAYKRRPHGRTSRYTFKVHPCLSMVNLHVASRHCSDRFELRERLSQLAFSDG